MKFKLDGLVDVYITSENTVEHFQLGALAMLANEDTSALAVNDFEATLRMPLKELVVLAISSNRKKGD